MAAQQTTGIAPKAAITLELEALPDNVMLVRQAIDGAAREFGARGQTLADIKIAVTEACANVVRHAYGGEPGTLRVSLASDDSGTICIRIRDFGAWIPPVGNGHDDIAGMGVPLMKAVTTAFEVTRLDVGTEVVLEFDISNTDDRSGDPTTV